VEVLAVEKDIPPYIGIPLAQLWDPSLSMAIKAAFDVAVRLFVYPGAEPRSVHITRRRSPMATGETRKQTILRLADEVFSTDPHLGHALNRVGIDAGELKALAISKIDEIETATTAESESLSIAESQFESAKAKTIGPKVSLGLPTRERAGLERVSKAADLLLGLRFRSRRTVALYWTAVAVATFLASLAFPATLVVLSVVFALALVTKTALLLDNGFNIRIAGFTRSLNAGLGLKALEARAVSARHLYEEALLNRGIRPLAERRLSQLETPQYSTLLTYISSQGLSAVYDPAVFEIQTPVFDRVRGFLDQTSGGAIGIAGPRGSGKTTLINSFVEGRSRRSDGARSRAVRVSAPVDYESRDFIIHLFSELCASAIIPEARIGRAFPQTGRLTGSLRDQIGSQFGIAIGIGTVLVGASLWIQSYRRFEFDPLLVAGASLLLIGFVILLLQFAYRRRASAVRQWEQMAQEQAAPKNQPRIGISSATAQLAGQYLDLLRFQRTYTTGWSGSVRATAAIVEGTAEVMRGQSLMQTALGLPEIVNHFRTFVRQLATDGPVLIAVDELDKIETAEAAQSFLNDLKSVFGVDQCYFLISISEDALASFERRGLPVRDTFDSSLEEVVRVDPLDYQSSLRLVRGRVVGMPEPFAAFAHCLSGGLPRETIRYVRSIVRTRDSRPSDISSVVARVLEEDLEGKYWSTMAMLSHSDNDEDRTAIRRLGDMKVTPDPDSLLAFCLADLSALRRRKATPPSQAVSRDEHFDNTVVVPRPLLQLEAYFYFVATIRQVFTSELTESEFGQFTRSEGPGTVAQLARARQMFGSDAAWASSQISQFRSARAMGFEL
jgi:hypothetical protein